MSKTDKTRPVELQDMDLSRPGYILHCHTRESGGCVIELLPCDYALENNFQRFAAGRLRQPDFHCTRRILFPGGARGDRGGTKADRKLMRRQTRAQERQAIRRALQTDDWDTPFVTAIRPERFGKETGAQHFMLE